MKPDEVVQLVDEQYGLKTTRRTVLTYEKGNLLPAPYLETGKMKEYPNTAIGEFIASWGLIHSEYGIKPAKVAEIRDKALRIIYKFDSIWSSEIPKQEGINEFHSLVKQGISWRKPCDFFVYAWLMIKMAVTYGDEKDREAVKAFLSTGCISDIPPMNIHSDYNVSSKGIDHSRVWINDTQEFEAGKGRVILNFTDLESEFLSLENTVDMLDSGVIDVKAGYQGEINIYYIHPEVIALKNPI